MATSRVQFPSRLVPVAAIKRSEFAHRAEQLERELRAAVRLQPCSGASRSHVAGRPDVPSGFEWPQWDTRPHYLRELQYARHGKAAYGTPYWDERLATLDRILSGPTLRPLTFVAQIDLASVPRSVELPALPESGTLYFFCDVVNMPPGAYPSSRGGWQVIHRRECSGLAAMSPPPYPVEDGAEDYAWWTREHATPRAMEYVPQWTLPAEPPAQDVERARGSDDDDDAWEELCDEYGRLLHAIGQRHGNDGKDGEHRLFGHALPVQTPMEALCQFASNGIDLSRAGETEDAHPQLRRGIDDWQLLLQLDSDARVPWMFGDGGMLYFWIRRQDLARGDFSQVWGEMQCS